MTTSSEKGPSPIRTGNIAGIGITIGHHSSTSVNVGGQPEQAQAATRLDEFLELLAEHEDDVPDAGSARECAAAAKDELAAPAPRWSMVRGLLKGAAAGVAGVAALTDAISNILTLISHFPS